MNGKRVGRFMAMLGWLLLSFLSSRSQCVSGFSGVVQDADTRQQLADATITLRELNRSVKTDARGVFQFIGLCPGEYTLVITHIHCKPLETHIHVKDDLHLDFSLFHAEEQLKEVVIRGTAGAGATAIAADLQGRQLEATRGLTLGESLKRINGVTVLQTGNNIYKPVIHGLHSNRVLILNNGIRQEGQQWGSEHAPEIDPYLANRITVIKGASSIRYGGDAIGGVILVEPKLLTYGVPGLSGEVNTAMFSNNRMGVVSAMVEGNAKNKPAFAWRLQGTIKRGGNARTPGYWLDNSGVQEMNMSAAAGYQKQNKGLDLFYSLFSTRLGIFTGSHIGNVTDLENVISTGIPPDYIREVGFTYRIQRPYQRVIHNLVKAKAFLQTGEGSRLNLIGSFQYNQRQEFDIVRTPRSNPQLELGLFTSGLDVVWDHYKDKRFKGSIGINGTHQNNLINYRYFVPNYQSVNLGVFIAEKYVAGPWVAEAGIRYDWRYMYAITDNDDSPFDKLMGNASAPRGAYGDRNFTGFSGNVGVNYKREHWKWVFTATTAWRAPQVNEMFSDGLHHGAARIEKGSPDMDTERSWGLASGFEYNGRIWSIDIDIYNKWIADFIYLKPSYPPELTIRGAFPTFAFDQTDARLTGFDLQLQVMADAHLQFQGKVSMLRAYDQRANDWLIQMPADRYELSGEYLFDAMRKWKQTYLKMTLGHVRRQDRVPATGNIEIRTPAGIKMASDYAAPPPAYTLVGLEAGTKLDVRHRELSFILGVTNLFNVRYRDYLNAFRYFADDMGRNISLRVKIPIEFIHPL